MADPRKYDAPGSPGEIPEAGGARRDPPAGRDRAREAAEEVRQTATSLLDETRRDGKQMLDRQKNAATEEVGAAASALRSAADDLRRQHGDRASRFVEFAADRLESFGNTVRHKDIDSLINDAERLGRRSPGAFFAGSVALGFLLSRFLKSSARRPSSDAAQQREGDGSAGVGSMEGLGTPWTAAAAEPVGAAAPYPTGAMDRSEAPATPTTEVTR